MALQGRLRRSFLRHGGEFSKGADEPLANVGSTDARCREWLAGNSHGNLVVSVDFAEEFLLVPITLRISAALRDAQAGIFQKLRATAYSVFASGSAEGLAG